MGSLNRNDVDNVHLLEFSSDEGDSEDEALSSKRGSSQREQLRCVVTSDAFAYTIGFVIVINTLMMTIQVDHADLSIWPYVENTFLFIFFIELSLRLYVFRMGFFIPGHDERRHDQWEALLQDEPEEKEEKEWAWNIFDFTIVFCGVCDLWILKLVEFIFGVSRGHGIGQVVTILRALRVLRILRLIRVIKVFRELHCLALAFVSSMKSVFWISILFAIIIVVTAIFCTTMIGKQAADFEDPRLVESAFGTVPASCDTLFQFVTLDDWSSVARSLSQTHPWLQIFFCLYILLTAFMLLSLLTGVVTENMAKYMASEDEKSEQMYRKFVQNAEEMFREAGHQKDTVNVKEFAHLFHKKGMHKRLLQFNIDVGDDFAVANSKDDPETERHNVKQNAVELFGCLDHESNGEIGLGEFRDGLIRMRGSAKAKDLMRMQSAISRMKKKVGSPTPESTKFPMDVSRRLNALISTVTVLLIRATALEEELTAFSRTIPELANSAR